MVGPNERSFGTDSTRSIGIVKQTAGLAPTNSALYHERRRVEATGNGVGGCDFAPEQFANATTEQIELALFLLLSSLPSGSERDLTHATHAWTDADVAGNMGS